MTFWTFMVLSRDVASTMPTVLGYETTTAVKPEAQKLIGLRDLSFLE
jgi:hypothetical protein